MFKKSNRPDPSILLFQIELFNNRVVALFALALEILQVGAAVCNHLQKAPSRVLILEVFFEVARELLNALAQDGNLNLGRPGVLLVNARFFNCFLLLPLRQHGTTLAHLQNFRKMQ